MSNAEREFYEAALAELRAIRAASTDLAGMLTGRAVNGVLETNTLALDSSGLWTRAYGTTIGSVLVGNPSTSATLTVMPGAPSGTSTPTTGIGVWVIPPTSLVPVPIDNRAVTIYGTTGQTFSVQVFSGMQAYGIGRGR